MVSNLEHNSDSSIQEALLLKKVLYQNIKTLLAQLCEVGYLSRVHL
jgi:hypothetical protein